MENQNQLQIYNFQDNAVRTTQLDGDVWWIAKDVCSILGLSNPTKALRCVDADDLTLLKVRAGGQDRELNIINEAGLYTLILRSNKPQAKAFKRWVTHEVLPAIRRTGSYSVSRGGEADEIAARLTLIEEEVKRLKLDRAAEQNAKRLPGDFPKQPPYIKIYYTRVCTAVSPELQEYIAERLPFEHGDRAKLYEEVRKKNDRPISQATFYRLCSTLENLLCTPEPVESTEGKA
ncbi:BRO-N domain-containing protein [Synergistes jonesii]|uniref:BRO-N domain-containing protein n=1 Tax=Synergistes jonesii TaxID=2754 RepID=UPI00332125EA